MTTDKPKLKPLDLGASGRQFAENLKRLRTLRGMSLRELSQHLKEVKLSADAINKIEKQQRRATIDELVALAVVLEVHPNALLLPHQGSGDIEITGAGAIPARDAWKWANGKRPLHIPEDDDGTALVDFQRYAHPKGLRNYPVSTRAGLEFAEEDGIHEMARAAGIRVTRPQKDQEDNDT